MRRLSHASVLRQLVTLFVILHLSITLPAADKSQPQPEKIGKGLNFFSQNQEVAMGRSYSEELNRELQLVDHPEVSGYVERIGRRLVAVSLRKDLEYRFFVVNTSEVNAFALPGGYIYVNRGLIEKAENESELAGVIGHEIGHVVGKHSLKQLSKRLLLSGVTVGAGLAVSAKSRKWGEVVMAAGGIGVFFASLKYSRDDEREADWLGLTQLYQAGYDPSGMVTFFEKLEAMSKGSGRMPAFLSTHPLPAERKANMRRQLAGLSGGPKPDTYAADFRRCRTRLAAVPLPPPGKEKTLGSALAQLDSRPESEEEPDRTAAGSRRPASQMRTITMPGNSVWLDSGVDIEAGDLIEIEAAGRVQWKKNSQESCGPDGIPGKGFWKPLSKANTAALIGKVGESSYNYFVIGSHFRDRSSATGRLFLGINDDNNTDNRGSFEVRIRIGP
jgi:beta-barrel assembly-enhancing protease